MELERLSAEELLEWAFQTFQDGIAFASSFQAESSVLIDMAHRLRGSDFRIFTLDTGRLNQEAYDCMDAIRQRYGVAVEVYFPDALKVQEMVRRDPPRHRLAPADRRSPRRHARELETRGRRHHGPGGHGRGSQGEVPQGLEGAQALSPPDAPAQVSQYYPVALDLRDRPCLVVGGGSVAEGKVEGLLDAGARVTVVSPALSERLASWATEGRIAHRPREYAISDLDGHHLAFSATDRREVTEVVAADAKRRGVWVNAADDPTYCDFLLPSVLRRGRLQVAVSTGGASSAPAGGGRTGPSGARRSTPISGGSWPKGGVATPRRGCSIASG